MAPAAACIDVTMNATPSCARRRQRRAARQQDRGRDRFRARLAVYDGRYDFGAVRVIVTRRSSGAVGAVDEDQRVAVVKFPQVALRATEVLAPLLMDLIDGMGAA